MKELQKQIYNKGFNIYLLINKFRKLQKQRKALYEVPDEVYLETCKEILKRLENYGVKDKWAYFMHVLTMKSHEYFANKHQTEAKDQQFSRQMPEHLRNLLNGKN